MALGGASLCVGCRIRLEVSISVNDIRTRFTNDHAAGRCTTYQAGLGRVGSRIELLVCALRAPMTQPPRALRRQTASGRSLRSTWALQVGGGQLISGSNSYARPPAFQLGAIQTLCFDPSPLTTPASSYKVRRRRRHKQWLPLPWSDSPPSAVYHHLLQNRRNSTRTFGIPRNSRRLLRVGRSALLKPSGSAVRECIACCCCAYPHVQTLRDDAPIPAFLTRARRGRRVQLPDGSGDAQARGQHQCVRACVFLFI